MEGLVNLTISTNVLEILWFWENGIRQDLVWHFANDAVIKFVHERMVTSL